MDVDMAREILARGDKFLETQLQLAIAADQRATTAASILASAAAAAVGGLIAFWANVTDKSPLVAGMVGAAFLLLAAGLAGWAARPTDFESPGNHPAQWFDGRKGELATMIGGEAESVQRRIEKNDRILSRNQMWLRIGFWIALAAPLAAVATWLLR